MRRALGVTLVAVDGISVGGLAVVGNGQVRGVSVAGLAVVSNGQFTGLALGGLAVVGSQGLRGVAIGGVHVEGGSIRGLAISPIRTRTWDLRGVSVAGYNRIKGEQRGLTIGIYNYAKRLHGVQLGLINNARNNRGLLRVLPLVNVHLHLGRHAARAEGCLSTTGRFGFFSRGSRTPRSGFSFKSRRPSFVRSLVAQFSAVKRTTRSASIARSRTPFPGAMRGSEPSPCRRTRIDGASGLNYQRFRELAAILDPAVGAIPPQSWHDRPPAEQLPQAGPIGPYALVDWPLRHSRPTQEERK